MWLVPAQAGAATVDLSAYRGKVVYLDFWASWCEPCRKSFPWLNAMRERYAREGMEIVSVNLDENRADADRFLARTAATFGIIYDPAGDLARTYKVDGLPSSILIDRKGDIFRRHRGFTRADPDKIESEIRGLLEAH